MKIKALLVGLEVDSRLHVANYKELGLRSPKLSKALAARGFNNRVISMLIELLTPVRLELTAARADCLAQSDSKHFTSCQAPGRKENLTEQDAQAAQLGHLYLAVVRTPEGFSYRAKVRRCVNFTTGETRGWYIEKEYGNGRPLLSDFARILKNAGESAYNRLAYCDPRFSAEEWPTIRERVVVPSFNFGYQDSLNDPYQTLTFSLVGESSAGELNIPLRRNPFRRRGVIEDSLSWFLYGPPEEEHPRRFPEEVALRRMLKKLRRENPHVRWRTRNGRHAVTCWQLVGFPPPLYALVSGFIDALNVGLEIELKYDWDTLGWRVKLVDYFTFDAEENPLERCDRPPGFQLSYEGWPLIE